MKFIALYRYVGKPGDHDPDRYTSLLDPEGLLLLRAEIVEADDLEASLLSSEPNADECLVNTLPVAELDRKRWTEARKY
jgi:hypothetical protein